MAALPGLPGLPPSPCRGRRRAGRDGPSGHSRHPVDAGVGSVGPATPGRAQLCAQQAYNSREDPVCGGSPARDAALLQQGPSCPRDGPDRLQGCCLLLRTGLPRVHPFNPLETTREGVGIDSPPRPGAAGTSTSAGTEGHAASALRPNRVPPARQRTCKAESALPEVTAPSDKKPRPSKAVTGQARGHRC